MIRDREDRLRLRMPNDRENTTGQQQKVPVSENEIPRTGPLTEAVLLGAASSGHASLDSDVSASASISSALIGLLMSYAVLIVGNGLLGTLIPVRMMHSSMTSVQIGLVQSCYYVGFVIGAFINKGLIERIGQHRTFVAYAAAAAIVTLGFGAFTSPWVFAVIRLMSGFIFMGLYTAVESWLNGAVNNANRGRVFGSYLTINYLAIGSGQFLLTVGDASGNTQLFIVATLFTAAVIPVTLMDGWPTRVRDDQLNKPRSIGWVESVRTMMAATPLAVPGCIIAGLLYSAFYAMTPVYLAHEGFSIDALSTIMGYALIGALVPQWPVGRLSDRYDRRTMIKWMAVCSAVSAACLMLTHTPWVIRAALVVYVAGTFTQYGLIVSHINDRTDPVHRVATSTTLLILFSAGGILGPLIASLMMALFGPHGLFVFACVSACTLAFLAHSASGPRKPAAIRAGRA